MLTGAGGVGGLLMASFEGTNCFTAYDGNGNITALINAIDKTTAARYEYNPYGDLTRATGLLAHSNPFRYSSKFWDNESSLIYFNFRYYSPGFGRWISRDISGEKGGLNLLLFTGNSPPNAIDPDGNIGVRSLFFAVAHAVWQLFANYKDEAGGCAELPAVFEIEQAAREAEGLEAVKMSKNRAAASGRTGGVVVVTVISIAIIETDTAILAAVAYEEVEFGVMSADPLFANLGGFFRGLRGGDEAEGDLDATMAALQIGGYTDSGVLASWGALQTIGDSSQ